MSGYCEFAEVYDRLMSDVPYGERAAYLARLFKKHDRMPRLLLDVACGTGNFSLAFAHMGAEVIGADPSAEMLAAAREKAAASGQDILFLCQPAEELDLYGTVDGAICCLDSLNHIPDYEDFCAALARVTLFLETGRLFIFDLNTIYKHETVLADHIFIIEQNGVYCVWQNETDRQTHTTDILLDFFVEENGVYRRGTDAFCERAYSPEAVEEAIRRAGLETVAVYDDMTEAAPGEKAERVVYVTRKTAETLSCGKETDFLRRF